MLTSDNRKYSNKNNDFLEFLEVRKSFVKKKKKAQLIKYTALCAISQDRQYWFSIKDFGVELHFTLHRKHLVQTIHTSNALWLCK